MGYSHKMRHCKKRTYAVLRINISVFKYMEAEYHPADFIYKRELFGYLLPYQHSTGICV
jgi:hypothetical protein